MRRIRIFLKDGKVVEREVISGSIAEGWFTLRGVLSDEEVEAIYEGRYELIEDR